MGKEEREKVAHYAHSCNFDSSYGVAAIAFALLDFADAIRETAKPKDDEAHRSLFRELIKDEVGGIVQGAPYRLVCSCDCRTATPMDERRDLECPVGKEIGNHLPGTCIH